MQRIKQVSAMLNYGDHKYRRYLKILRLHICTFVLFPVENLQQAVDVAKRILTKENLDRQLTGQSTGASDS